MWYVELGPGAKALRRYLATSGVLVLLIPILDSVSFRGLSLAAGSAYIVEFLQHGIWEGGRKPNSLSRFLA